MKNETKQKMKVRTKWNKEQIQNEKNGIKNEK